MAESHGFVKLPPDGTGKRIPHTVMFEVSYNTGTTAFVVGDLVTFGTSGFTATVIEVEGNTTTGNLHLKLEEPVPAVPAAIIGESLPASSAMTGIFDHTKEGKSEMDKSIGYLKKCLLENKTPIEAIMDNIKS